jgi:hypothetical protein
VGVVAFAGTAIVLAARMLGFAAAEAEQGRHAALAVAGALAGWFATLLVGWTTPLAGLAAASLGGALIARRSAARPAPGPAVSSTVDRLVRPTLAAGGLASLALAVAFAAPLVAEIGHATTPPEAKGESLSRIAERGTWDPSYVAEAQLLLVQIAAQDPAASLQALDEAARLAAQYRSTSPWSGALALADMERAWVAYRRGIGSWEDVERAADSARATDGRTGFFAMWLATRAREAGLPERARYWARRSLAEEESEDARRLLSELGGS